MSKKHAFILTPQAFLGEGTIELSMVEEKLKFYTRWTCLPKDDSGAIVCQQEIQIQGVPEVMHNEFTLYDFTSEEFKLNLENQALGKVEGSGLIHPELIAWEIKDAPSNFEGFEFYQAVDDESYLMRAEYCTEDEYRTLIQGRIWKKTEE